MAASAAREGDREPHPRSAGTERSLILRRRESERSIREGNGFSFAMAMSSVSLDRGGGSKKEIARRCETEGDKRKTSARSGRAKGRGSTSE